MRIAAVPFWRSRWSRLVLFVLCCGLVLMFSNCGGVGGSAHASSGPPNSGGGGTGGGGTGGGGTPLTPTTTLQAETGNNTSAADSFAGETNGNPPGRNVSKVDTHSLLYPGATTAIYAAFQGWFGGPDHVNVGYHSDDPAEVHRQVEDMISRGIQGAIVDWFGDGSLSTGAARVNNTTKLLQKEAESHPGFKFAVMEDVGALLDAANRNGCDVTHQLISDVRYAGTQYTSSPAYLKINGRPVIMFFGVNAWYIDWQRAVAALPQFTLMFREGEGFNQPQSNGAFAWVDLVVNDPFNPQLAAQDAFYQQAVSTPSRVSFGSAYKGFNDTIAEWSTNRVIQQQCGQTWLATFSEIGKYYSSSRQLPALQLVTWNDYEEGSAIEPGIDNCVYVSPSTSGNTLNWAVAGGSENTIDHYTIFESQDGAHLAKVADVPSGTHSYDLSSLKLAQGNYILYVKAVGRPSIQNKMSPAITFRPGDQPPNINLSITAPGNLTLAVSTAGSTDPDGSIAQSTIDFGDGTVQNGTNITHTYAAAGVYVVTATVTDNMGASAVAVRRVSVKPLAPGVTITTPGNNSVVNWPSSVVASANASAPVTTMQIMIDGQQAYATNSDVVNTGLKIFRGTHTITVNAYGQSGLLGTSSTTVNAEPNDLSPTAVVSFRPLPGAPNTILGCSAGSFDPDGFILQRQFNLSDGSVFIVPSFTHTFPPGSYSGALNVIDQFGAPASASGSFSVGGAATTTTGTTTTVNVPQTPVNKPQAEPIRQP